MERTTDLETIRRHPRSFTWGHVEKIYDIADYYTIVEFTPVRNGKVCPSEFHIYVDGKDMGCSTLSIEGALIQAIALGGFENKNVAWELARSACKLLEIEG